MKQTWLQKIETYVIVTIITVLIWLYAEGSTIKPYEDFLTLRFVSASGTPLVINPESYMVKISYKCRKDVVDQIKDIAANPVELKVIENSDSSDLVLLMKDRLMADDSPLAKLGFNLETVDPKTIALAVEPLVTRPVKVILIPGQTQLISQPVLDPPQVEVQMPDSYKVPDVEIRMDQIENIDSLEENVDITRDLSVTLPIHSSRENVKLLQHTVKVTFRIASGNEPYTISRVPVYISLPPSKLKEYDFVLSEDDRVLSDVKIEGPSDIINQIRNKQIPIHAVLRLTPEQMDQNDEVWVTPTIDLPKDVTLSALNPLEVKITRRPNGNGNINGN